MSRERERRLRRPWGPPSPRLSRRAESERNCHWSESRPSESSHERMRDDSFISDAWINDRTRGKPFICRRRKEEKIKWNKTNAAGRIGSARFPSAVETGIAALSTQCLRLIPFKYDMKHARRSRGLEFALCRAGWVTEIIIQRSYAGDSILGRAVN